MARYITRIFAVGRIYYGIAILLAVALWLLLRSEKLPKRAALTILLPYLFLVVSTAVFAREASENKHLILRPFWTLQAIVTGGKSKAWLITEVYLNVFMLFPVGVLAPLLFDKRKLSKTLLLGGAVSLTIELLQLLTHRGYAETDDILYNMLGVLAGYGVYSLVRKIVNVLKSKPEESRKACEP